MTLGIPVAGRDHPDTAEVVGYLVDTLPLRLCPDPHATLAETLDATRARVDDVRAHPRMPLEELLREARPQGDRGPLFQALLAVNGTPPRYELAGLEMSPAPVPFRTTPMTWLSRRRNATAESPDTCSSTPTCSSAPPHSSSRTGSPRWSRLWPTATP